MRAAIAGRKIKLQHRPAPEALDQIDHAVREIADVCDKIGAEIGESNLPRREHEHDAEQDQIHQIDDYDREKSPVIS